MPDTLDRLKAALADRYRVDREIGRGGMAQVFLAHDLKLDRPVALKVLRPDLAAVLGGERFLREITLAAKLEHPHILGIHDSGEADGLLYYVMPYVEGESLRGRLAREKQLPLDDALQISREVADALSYAHSRGVIHRDIKPENILLEGGHAVVADFGIARAIDAAGGDRLTETGVTLGTPAYMSPEQAAGSRDLDGRSDLYSLGCVLYEMLAGQPPFAGPTLESVIHQHLTAEPPSITVIRPAVPGWVAAALTRSLAKTPADRFNPVAQFAEAIAPRLSMAEVPVAPAVPVPSVQPRRWRWVAAVVAAVVVLAGGWAGWSALHRHETPPSPVGPRPYTIVAEVEGNADPEVRQTVRAMLGAALDESRIVAVLPEDQIQRGLALAGKPDTTTLHLAMARELAVRGAIRTVVAGSVDRAGTTYHVSVRVVDADSGTVLAAERAVARGDDDVIPVVDRLMRGVRQQLGERPEAIAPTRPFSEASTPSFAAFQHYARGNALFRRADAVGALREYRAALALDPGFANAWSGLASALGNTGDSDGAIRALDSALAHADRLTDGQRLFLEARIAIGRWDFATAADLLRRQIDQYGPSEVSVGWLAVSLSDLGRLEEAVALMEELERSPPPFGLEAAIYVNTAEYLAALGRHDDARRQLPYLARELAAYAGMFNANAEGEWDRADSLAEVILHDSENPRWRWHARFTVASSAAARGRVQAATGQLREVIASDQARHRAEGDRRAYHLIMVLVVASGQSLDRTALRTIRGDTTPGGRSLTALWAAALGDTALAQRELASVRALAADRRNELAGELVLCDAWLAEQRGDRAVAIDLLRAGAEPGTFFGPPVNQLTRWTLAATFERQGQLDSAAARFARLAQWIPSSDLDRGLRGLTHSFVNFRLGRLYTQLGKNDEAKQHYATFLESFTQPDPEYAWMVTEARAKLEGLARGR
jgi:tetratricopeptide (TPR) repeat protein